MQVQRGPLTNLRRPFRNTIRSEEQGSKEGWLGTVRCEDIHIRFEWTLLFFRQMRWCHSQKILFAWCERYGVGGGLKTWLNDKKKIFGLGQIS